VRVIIVAQHCKTPLDLREMAVSERQWNKLQGFSLFTAFNSNKTIPCFSCGWQITKRKEKTAKNRLPPQEQSFSIFTVVPFPSQQQCDRGYFFHLNPLYIMRYGSKNCWLSKSSNSVLMLLYTERSEWCILITGHPAYLRNCEIGTREKRWMSVLWDESHDSRRIRKKRI